MKKKLLYLACFATSLTFAQSIATFNSVNMSEYANVDGTVDQSPTGASTTWNFTSLTSTGTSTDSYAAPTSMETTTFPGTTNVFTSNGNNIFLKDVAGEVSLTGATIPDFELNYGTDNALIGTFPLSFGYMNSDAVAGTFSYQGTNGTFTGNIVKTVDAHGTLNMNDVGAGAYSGAVTRLKTEQTVSLSIPPIFNNIGTVTQTTINYYDNNNGNLVFRNSVVNIVSGFLGINDTSVVNESLLTNLLSVNENVVAAFSVVPNPVQSILNVNLKTPTAIKSIVVFDLNGRQVLHTTNNTTAIDVSALQAGMYLLKVQTDREVLTKKFIKK